MTMRPDSKQIAALAHIVRAPIGEPLLELLEAELAAAKDTLITCHGDNILRMQGRAAVLKELVKLLHEAPQLAASL